MTICNTAYDKAYLEDVMNVHALLFSKLADIKKYSVCSMIDVYMRYSDVRDRMDKGNWSALNKGYRQLLNSIDFFLCEPRGDEEEFDGILLEWIANMYVLLQWKYNIPSSEINEKIPAKEMRKAYNPLHETSYENACEKIYNKYLA